MKQIISILVAGIMITSCSETSSSSEKTEETHEEHNHEGHDHDHEGHDHDHKNETVSFPVEVLIITVQKKLSQAKLLQ